MQLESQLLNTRRLHPSMLKVVTAEEPKVPKSDAIGRNG